MRVARALVGLMRLFAPAAHGDARTAAQMLFKAIVDGAVGNNDNV